MFLIYTESTLQVKQMVLTLETSTDYGSAKCDGLNKCEAQPQQKSGYTGESLECFDVKKIKKTLKNNTRYKTELCRQFCEWGRCDYGDRCMFAHGKHELNEQVCRHRNYKTRICTTYEFDGFCTFGSRCAFVHRHPDPIELLERTMASYPRIPMPENKLSKFRPEFYPSDMLVRKPDREMSREEELLPSQFIKEHSLRLSAFKRLTNSE